MKLLKSCLIVAILLLSGCGKVAEELNPMYTVKIKNPEKAALRCTWTVDGQSKTQETEDDEFFFQSNKANEFLYISCQKTEKGTKKVTAEFLRNESAQEADECAVDYCIVVASGLTK